MPNIVTGFCKEVVIFTAMQLNKSIKNFLNYFLGPLLFLWLFFSIYQNIKNQPQLSLSWQGIQDSFGSVQVVYLLVALLLIFVNWGLEALKWKLSVAAIHPVSFLQAFKAVLSGVSFSVTMPNRVGEYLGRVLYLPEGFRLKTISVTLVGSFAQLLVTLGMGIAGLVVLKKELLLAYPQLVFWYQFVLYGLMALVVFLLLLYFSAAGSVQLFRRWIRHPKYLYLVEALDHFRPALLSRLLLFSFLRYLVFVVQYILLFRLFGVDVPAMIIFWVMSAVFLAMAIVPSIALLEVGIRGEICLRLMGVFSTNSLAISLTSLTVWFINLVLPAIIGSLLILRVKIFSKR